jgi:Probable cobalt transporter subunit (CbtA)
MELLAHLKRGALAGLAGGALTGVFGLAFAEPALDRAVRLESAREVAGEAAQRAAGQDVAHHAEVFARSTQHVGLLAASLVTGLALGVLFGVVYAVRHPGNACDRTDRAWPRALALGGAAWCAVYLVPFVRYPANPPA